MRVRTVSCCFSLFLLLGLVHADDRPDGEASSGGTAAQNTQAEKRETIVYSARGVAASELAATLDRIFNQADLRAVAEPANNLLIMQVDAKSRDAVLRLLEQLDRPLHSMIVQLHLLKTRGKDLEPFDTKALSGPSGKVLSKIQQLEAAGRIYIANRMELTAVENNVAMLQAGEQVPLVTRKMPARGDSLDHGHTQHVGTLISVITRVTQAGAIDVELKFEKSEIVEEKQDLASPIEMPGAATLTQQTTLVLRNGHSALAGTLVARSPGTASEEAYLVVGATLLEAHQSDEPIIFRSFSQRESTAAWSSSRTDGGGEKSHGRAGGESDRYATYARTLMNKYDKNKDGVLTSDEWKSMPRDPAAADTNKDDKISLDEFTAWIASRRITTDPPRRKKPS